MPIINCVERRISWSCPTEPLHCPQPRSPAPSVDPPQCRPRYPPLTTDIRWWKLSERLQHILASRRGASLWPHPARRTMTGATSSMLHHNSSRTHRCWLLHSRRKGTMCHRHRTGPRDAKPRRTSTPHLPRKGLFGPPTPFTSPESRRPTRRSLLPMSTPS